MGHQREVKSPLRIMRYFSWFRSLTGHENSLRKQDGPWSWVVLACTVLQSWINIGMIISYSVFLPVLMKEFNAGRNQIALIGSLALGEASFISVFSSGLVNIFGSRVICSLGHVFLIVAFSLSSLIQNKNVAFFTYSFLFGIGSSFINISNISCIVKYFKKHRSLALGIYYSGVALGMMTLPIIMQYLLDAMGWRNAFRVVAASFFFFGLLCIVYSPNVETEAADPTEETTDQQNQNCITLRSVVDLSVWKVPKFVFAVVSIGVASFAMYSPMFHLVKFAQEIGISALDASALFTFCGIATLISRICIGKLCDLPYINASMVNMFTQLFSAVILFCLTLSNNYINLATVIILFGLADGAYQTSTLVLFTSSVIPSKATSAYGQALTVESFSTTAGPAVAGWLADITGTYTISFYVCSFALVAGAAVHLIPIFIRLKTPNGSGTAKKRNEIPLSNASYNDRSPLLEADSYQPNHE